VNDIVLAILELLKVFKGEGGARHVISDTEATAGMHLGAYTYDTVWWATAGLPARAVCGHRHPPR
jgi:hypothetical protein